jgi:hypothetical protein
MKTSIKVNREDIKSIVKEEQYLFTKNVLIAIGLPLENCFPNSDNPDDITIEHKIKLKEVLKKWGVLVLDDRDGKIEIYITDNVKEHKLIARWNKCKYELRQDLAAIDPKRKIYAVIHIDYWTEFEK